MPQCRSVYCYQEDRSLNISSLRTLNLLNIFTKPQIMTVVMGILRAGLGGLFSLATFQM
jgi:hypothetical protein